MSATSNREESRWRLQEGDEIVPGRHAIRRLGGGHRYEAYLAWDDRLHALTVVKVVRPDLVDDPHTLAGVAREAEMLATLDHPVIVRGFGAVLDGPRPHLVLEHLEGPRLSTLVRRYGPLPSEQLLPLALQLCSALHYLAAEDVVHLDVKPSNVIMGGPPRLIDLSVAMSRDAAASLDYPIGTDSYMAPEQCDPVGRGGVGPEADVWGLGATLYKAATGERPFRGPGDDWVFGGESAGERGPLRTSREERWPQLIGEAAPIDARLPTALRDSIMSCLAGEPAARPRPTAIAATLEPVLAAMPGPRLSRLKPRLR